MPPLTSPIGGSVMPAAAKLPRRPEGWLRSQVRATLTASNAPISAHQMSLRIKADHPAVHTSSVFRAVNRMMEDGEIDRVELLSGYIPKRPEAVISMLCTCCGGCTLLEGQAPTLALQTLAQPLGFKPTRFIIEMEGICSLCAQTG